MITSVKKLIGENDENLGKWFQVSGDEEEAIRDSISPTNYERGASYKPSLRMYTRDGYVVVCTQGTMAEPHPNEVS